MTSDLKKCFIEFLGTFLLAFTILACALLPVKPMIIPIVIGLALTTVMFAGGSISGGNYNPLITFSVFMSGKMGSKKAFLYAIFQLFGAIYAALMVSLFSSAYSTQPEMQFKIAPMFWGEFIFTVALIYVFMFTFSSKKNKNNEYYGIALGSVLTVGNAIAGGICLATFNPFILLAFFILGYATMKTFLVALVAQFVAMFVACGLFNLLNVDNVEDVEVVNIDEFIKK